MQERTLETSSGIFYRGLLTQPRRKSLDASGEKSCGLMLQFSPCALRDWFVSSNRKKDEAVHMLWISVSKSKVPVSEKYVSAHQRSLLKTSRLRPQKYLDGLCPLSNILTWVTSLFSRTVNKWQAVQSNVLCLISQKLISSVLYQEAQVSRHGRME